MLKTNNQLNNSPTLSTLGCTTFFNEKLVVLDLLEGTVHAHTTERLRKRKKSITQRDSNPRPLDLGIVRCTEVELK